MKILVIGSGGREHSIVYNINRTSPDCEIFAFPGNPGIFNLAKPCSLDLAKHQTVIDFCLENNIDFVFIGPEQPLAEGLSDSLRESKINVFGPSKFAAQLETSKDFAKEMMLKYNIPTATYRTFTTLESDDAHQYIDGHSLPIVLKADGLAAGKGVIIANTHHEAHNSLNEMFEGEFGDAGKKVVIEQYLNGEEASVFAICDGNNYVVLAPAQDHKRIGDGDTGKNTGGMGAYAPAKVVNKEVMEKVENRIIKPILDGMKNEGYPFVGCLFCGLMIDDNVPYVIEFNARFGDPETQVVLSLTDGNLSELFYSASIGKINQNAVKISENKAGVCVVLASDGYPDKFDKNFEISGINEIEENGLTVFHAGTKLQDGKLFTNGGRVLGVTSLSENLKKALENVYTNIDKINFVNKYYRKDIGFKGL